MFSFSLLFYVKSLFVLRQLANDLFVFSTTSEPQLPQSSCAWKWISWQIPQEVPLNLFLVGYFSGINS